MHKIIVRGNKGNNKYMSADFESLDNGNAAIDISGEMKKFFCNTRLVGSANALEHLQWSYV